MNALHLIRKYNVPGPRYTSYPTVPHWDVATFDPTKWQNLVTKANNEFGTGISLYIHLPYCESLCTYCGCHKVVTRNHAHELPYIQAVIKEWKMYVANLGTQVKISEIHLGGGTPSFFSPNNLQLLISSIINEATLDEDVEMSWEGHPNNTTYEHLKTLYDLGFKRVSFGVQDGDPVVQKAIHRIQPWENVYRVIDQARSIGYTSVNVDLIYGLPFQTKESIVQTFEKITELKPDRIAFYSYAHVPWVQKSQRLFSEQDLPTGIEKRTLYETGRSLLTKAGYQEIGMDHFSLPTDSLFYAYKNNTLHRNFMGYTTTNTRMLIGLGASAISDAWYGYAQNEKSIPAYVSKIEQGELPVFKGHTLSREELLIRQHILNLMCQFKTKYSNTQEEQQLINKAIPRLQEMEQDGLVAIVKKGIVLSDKGKNFVRNICMAFDQKLWESQPDAQLFSSTI